MERLLLKGEAINRWLGKVAAAAVLLIAGLQFVIVLARYMFGFNVIWLQDMVTYGHAAIFMLGAATTFASGGHVRIDILYNRWSKEQQARVDFYGALLLLLPFCLLMLWLAVPYVVESWQNLEGSFQTMGLQFVYLLKSLLIIFPASLMVQGMLLAFRAYRVMESVSESTSGSSSEQGY